MKREKIDYVCVFTSVFYVISSHSISQFGVQCLAQGHLRKPGGWTTDNYLCSLPPNISEVKNPLFCGPLTLRSPSCHAHAGDLNFDKGCTWSLKLNFNINSSLDDFINEQMTCSFNEMSENAHCNFPKLKVTSSYDTSFQSGSTELYPYPFKTALMFH